MPIRKKSLTALAFGLLISGCGNIYTSPTVSQNTSQSGLKVQILPLNAETTMAANRTAYLPQKLPREFFSSAGLTGSARATAQPPEPVLSPQSRPTRIIARIPANSPLTPYTIGIGDSLLLATPSAANTVEQLTGLLAAENSRQGYKVQDDGSIAVPSVGRVAVAGLTLAQAEEALFERLLDVGMDPSVSVEIIEFGSQKISLGGAVAKPGVIPITLSPLKLLEALQMAGGITIRERNNATVRIMRDGSLFQIPANDLYDSAEIQALRLEDGDSVFVDESYSLDQAQAYFEQQIETAVFRRTTKSLAMSQLQTEITLRRAELQERRANFGGRLELDAVERDYVYLAGEVSKQARVALPFDQRATLADILFGQGGFATRDGDPSQIYVLRGSPHPAEFAGLTAYQLDGKNAANLILATRFEMRPNDIVFIAEQPVTRWNRVISQITPSVVSSVAAASGI